MSSSKSAPASTMAAGTIARSDGRKASTFLCLVTV